MALLLVRLLVLFLSLPLLPAAAAADEGTGTGTGTDPAAGTVTPGSTITGTAPATGTVDVTENPVPTGTYATYATRLTLGSSAGGADVPSASEASSGAVIPLQGTRTTGPAGTASSSSASATSAPAQATNSQPCNGHVEFCTRRYSNITFVAAHNSPFVRPDSAAANQEFAVTEQLNDGIRLLQGQVHVVAGVPRLCHTSCDLLDAGPLADWLGAVKAWVDAHPFDVVTVLIGNGGYDDPSALVPAIESTGIVKYAYAAPYLPMALRDWPTLAEMIILGRRVVFLLDYKADQARYPWLLDEFGQAWETPFDPEDRTFPCTPQRPPGLADAVARDRLYVVNHNLNVNFKLLGAEILVPARSLLNETNGVAGNGSLGQSAANCRDRWGRGPNFLNVDYYNYGSPRAGSVFEVAAAMNGVNYTGTCCGSESAAAGLPPPPFWAAAAAAVLMAAAVLLEDL